MCLQLRGTMCPTGQRRRTHPLTGPTGPTVQPTTPVNTWEVWHGELCSTGDAGQDRHRLTAVFFGLWCCLVWWWRWWPTPKHVGHCLDCISVRTVLDKDKLVDNNLINTPSTNNTVKFTVISGRNSTKFPASSAGNVSEPRLTSHVAKVRRCVCA
jgi:hypothetical protein